MTTFDLPSPPASVPALRQTAEALRAPIDEPLDLVKAFLNSVMEHASGLDFTLRSKSRDLLSIYVFGAVRELLYFGLVCEDELSMITACLLRREFGWSRWDASRRTCALLEAGGRGDSPLHAVLHRGARAFLVWCGKGGDFAGRDFRALVREMEEGRRGGKH